ncbi:MAG: molybdate ABC transporter substrate-binding protein [Gammaproteobacteria bacterium]|nr:molybdate ABC transporter substrate-binding protein [Gammaproteobacteria bacterium]
MSAVLASVFCIIMLVVSSVTHAVELRIATAANFYPTLNKIKQNYEAITDNKIVIIRGSTGKLYAQIMRGAPYDIFFSADAKRADELVKKAKAIEINGGKKSFVYAQGKLALWHADADSSQQLREKLNSGNFNKLAIANPKTAPYGKASIEALQAMELYEELKHKLVYGENISQTMQFVQSGAADIGLVARSYVINDIYWEIDSYLHKPIKQKVILLKQSKQIDTAREFLQYIQSPAIKKLIKADGYDL